MSAVSCEHEAFDCGSQCGASAFTAEAVLQSLERYRQSRKDTSVASGNEILSSAGQETLCADVQAFVRRRGVQAVPAVFVNGELQKGSAKGEHTAIGAHRDMNFAENNHYWDVRGRACAGGARSRRDGFALMVSP